MRNRKKQSAPEDVYKRQVKPLPVAHLHDFTLEIFHSGVVAAVLAALPCVSWSVHVGQKRDFINPQGVDDDMPVSYTHLDVYKRQAQNSMPENKPTSS